MASPKQKAEEKALAVAIQDHVHNMLDAFLNCRDFGHNWRLFRLTVLDDHAGYERAFSCRSCKTNRVQVVSIYGAVASNQYTYPNGYRIEGMGKVTADTKANMRLEAILRELAKQDAKK